MTAQSALMQGPEATERFRVATKNQTVYVHAKKRCTVLVSGQACNKVITERQLKQYGCCAACFGVAK